MNIYNNPPQPKTQQLAGWLDTLTTAYTTNRQASIAEDQRKTETAIAKAQLEAEKEATERALALAQTENQKIAAQIKLKQLEADNRALLFKDVARVAVPTLAVGGVLLYLARKKK